MNGNDYYEKRTMFEEKIKEEEKKNNKLALVIYFFVFICLVYSGYNFYIDKYQYYILEKDVVMNVGADYQLKLMPKHGDDFVDNYFEYEVEDPSIVSIDSYGKVTALKNGTTNIIVKHQKMLEKRKMSISVDNIETNSLKIESSSVPVELAKNNDDEELHVKKGKTIAVKTTINNDNKIKKKVKYKSSDEKVAKIDDFGNLTPVGEGRVTISVETDDGVSKNVVVNVHADDIDVESIEFKEKDIILAKDETKFLDLSIKPIGVTEKNLTWSSSNDSVVSVDQTGLITGLKDGRAVIEVKSKNGVSASILIHVEEDLYISSLSRSIEVGDSFNLQTNKEVEWTSSNSKVASVDSFGTVVGLSEGKTTITGKYNNKSVKCEVTVTKKIIEVSSLSLDRSQTSMYTGDSDKVTTIISPSDATDKTVEWTSSDESIATVDANGNIVAKKDGEVTIKVKTKNNKVAELKIKVVKKPTEEQKKNEEEKDKGKRGGKETTSEIINISLDLNQKDIYIGDSFKLNYKFSSDKISNKDVKWSSSNSKIASVDKDGNVKGVSSGTATITITASNNSKANCIVNVSSKNIDVTGIKLNKSKVDLYVNESVNLIVTISPDDATNKSIMWSSSDSKIASVDSNGKVIAKKEGSATISVVSSNGKVAKANINVKEKVIEVESIILDKQSLILFTGESIDIKASVEPLNATDKKITWSSSDSKIASVDSNGKVTANKKGDVTITASHGKIKDECKVSVIEPISSVVEIDEIIMNIPDTILYVDDSINLSVTIKPSNASDKSIKWKSSNSSIVSVDSSGKVKAVNPGQAIITAYSGDKKTTCSINVRERDIAVDKVSLDYSSADMLKDDTLQLTVTVTPSNATNKSVTWSSSSDSVATVTSSGLVKAIGVGSAVITVKSINGNTATCNINVKEKSVSKYVDPVSTGFEITYYWGIRADLLTETDVKNMSNAGITLAQLKGKARGFGETNIYREEMAKAINLYKKYGIKVLVTDNYGVYGYYGNDSVYKSDDEVLEKIKDMVSYYSQFSNVIGYDICDEPNTKYFGRLKKIVDYIKQNDPKRIAYINLFPNYVTSGASGASDYSTGYLKKFASEVNSQFLSVDHYALLFKGDDVNKSKSAYYTDMNDVRKYASSYNMKPMMISLLSKHLTFKDLTRDEIAFQISLNLAFGMKRLSYFTYSVDEISSEFTNAMIDVNHNTTTHYKYVKEVNSWAKKIGDLLYSKSVKNIYGVNEVSTLSNYNSSDKPFGTINAQNRWTKESAPAVVSIFNDNSVLIVNTDLSKESEIITIGNMSNMQWYNTDVNKWIDLSAETGDNNSTIWFTPSNQEVILASGHAILLRKK